MLGKRVLVTGASGGVGRFAIQLAKLAGAHVTGLARRTAGLSELGADELIQALEPDGPNYDVIIDAVGGATLGAAIGRVAPSGTIINFAATSDEPVSYPTRTLFGRAPGARLYGLLVFPELAKHASGSSDLRRLAELVAAGKLDPQIDLVASWTDAGACDRSAARPPRERQGRADRRLETAVYRTPAGRYADTPDLGGCRGWS